MATAEELLMSSVAKVAEEPAEEILVADLTTRVISIPASIKILGVESDDDVKRLQFKLPRFYGEFDLSTFDIRINFENAKGKGDVYPVEDMSTSGGSVITFSWLVDRVALEYPGDVKFSICMKKYDSSGMVIKELNTTVATLPVLEGLETEKALIEQNPSAFDHVMYRLYAVEAATGNGQDGYYSVVKVSQVDNGALFTIVNQLGETIAYVKHGTDGYTPVKGVDYWTSDEQIEIKTAAADHAVKQATSYVNSWAPVITSIKLLKTGWSTLTQTVSVTGVTSDNLIVVSPKPDDTNYIEYARRGIRCINQYTNQLVFTCKSVPTTDVDVNIAIYYSTSSITGGSTTITVTDDGDGNVVVT